MSRRPLVVAIFSITILFSVAYNFYISSSPYQRCVKAGLELKSAKDFYDKCNKNNAWWCNDSREVDGVNDDKP
jgi:hypothetical protein